MCVVYFHVVHAGLHGCSDFVVSLFTHLVADVMGVSLWVLYPGAGGRWLQIYAQLISCWLYPIVYLLVVLVPNRLFVGWTWETKAW